MAGGADFDLAYSMSMRILTLVPLVLLGCSAGPPPSEDQQAREKAFEESMRGAALNGHFTIFRTDGSEPAAEEGGDASLRSERYEIEKVVKRAGDIWTFHARIQFGDTDVTVPVPVRLTWSGDTPMVSVTDLGLPGMGSYTARVIFYRDAYAGMWWGGSHGGNLFGSIERTK